MTYRRLQLSAAVQPARSADALYDLPILHRRQGVLHAEREELGRFGSIHRQQRNLTAGHVVHAGNNQVGGWSTNMVFVPAYKDGAAPFGQFTVRQLFTRAAWYQNGNPGGLYQDMARSDPESAQRQDAQPGSWLARLCLELQSQSGLDVAGLPARAAVQRPTDVPGHRGLRQRRHGSGLAEADWDRLQHDWRMQRRPVGPGLRIARTTSMGSTATVRTASRWRSTARTSVKRPTR